MEITIVPKDMKTKKNNPKRLVSGHGSEKNGGIYGKHYFCQMYY